MRGIFNKLGLIASGLLISGMAFAQDGMASDASGLIAIAAAIAVGMGTFGAASGQGKACSAAFDGIARNPNSKGDVFTPFILGLAFMEFQAILGFLISFLLMGKM